MGGIAELIHEGGRQGDAALNELTPLLYSELRRIARRQLRYENRVGRANTTSLVHEAYLRLAAAKGLRVQDCSHLLALAATLMRRILVDHARSRGRAKRLAGDLLPFEDAFAVARERSADLVRLDDCLDALSRIDSRKARVVEMRFFGGLTVDETARALGICEDTVIRDWRLAKVWLMREMRSSKR